MSVGFHHFQPFSVVKEELFLYLLKRTVNRIPKLPDSYICTSRTNPYNEELGKKNESKRRNAVKMPATLKYNRIIE
jgi:hypothetical protein